MLSQSRIVAICSLSILAMLPIFILYEEWVGHLVGNISELFISGELCSEADHYQGCDELVKLYRVGDKFGYGIYALVFYFGSSYGITRLLVQDRRFERKEALMFYTICIPMPFVVSYAGGANLPSVVFHFCLIYFGFVFGLFSGNARYLSKLNRIKK